MDRKPTEEELKLWAACEKIHQATIDCVKDRIDLKTFLKRVKETGLTLEDAIRFYETGYTVRTRDQLIGGHFFLSLIRFYYYTEFREKIPWAILPAEFRETFSRKLKERGKEEIKINPEHIRLAFPAYWRGTRHGTYEYWTNRILGRSYLPKGPGRPRPRYRLSTRIPLKLILIHKHDYEIPTRILLEGLDADASRALEYKQLWKKKKILSTSLFSAKNPFGFSVKHHIIKINKAGEKWLKFVFSKDTQKKWQAWIKDKDTVRRKFYK